MNGHLLEVRARVATALGVAEDSVAFYTDSGQELGQNDLLTDTTHVGGALTAIVLEPSVVAERRAERGETALRQRQASRSSRVERLLKLQRQRKICFSISIGCAVVGLVLWWLYHNWYFAVIGSGWALWCASLFGSIVRNSRQGAAFPDLITPKFAYASLAVLCASIAGPILQTIGYAGYIISDNWLISNKVGADVQKATIIYMVCNPALMCCCCFYDYKLNLVLLMHRLFNDEQPLVESVDICTEF
jgi:hypothetical protein